MKCLAVFLLLGLGLVSAFSIHSENLDVPMEVDQPEQDRRLGAILKKVFENLMEDVSKLSNQGLDKVFGKIEELYNRIKNLGFEVSEEAKNIFENLKSKYGRSEGKLGEILKKVFENMMDDVSKLSESGLDKVFGKIEELYNRIKNLGFEVSDEAKNIYENLKAKYGRSEGRLGEILKKVFENLMEDVPNLSEKGLEKVFGKIEELYNRIKNLGFEVSEEAKNIFENLKRKLGKSESTANADISNIFDLFKRLKNLIKEKLDSEELKAKVEQMFGKGSELAEQIINMLKTKGEKGKSKILDWIDRVLPDKEERSIKEVYEKIREFFKDLNIDLKERFTKFGEWVKEQYEKGLEKGKTKAENIRKIAKEFINDSKVFGKDMAEQALDFFREYKKDLGLLWDNVVDKTKKILDESRD